MSSIIHQGRATYAFFERNWNLTKRYWAWELVWMVYSIVNAMSVTYIGASMQLLTGAKIDTSFLILYLLIGTLVWTYLSITIEMVTNTISMERWEGTIEYTLMAPIPRFIYMIGTCLYALLHGLLFAFLQLLVLAAFFHLDLSHANYLSAVFVLLIGSIPFMGLSIATAVLTLLYTEKGEQMSHIAHAILLLVSGVYYPVEVLPSWLQPLARISPATYVLKGLRASLLDNQPIWSTDIWSNTWPLILAGIVSVPLGLYVFGVAERYAKRTGKLKRSG